MQPAYLGSNGKTVRLPRIKSTDLFPCSISLAAAVARRVGEFTGWGGVPLAREGSAVMAAWRWIPG